METMKLALTAMGICALLGAPTNAHAKFGAIHTQPSYRSQATQLSSSATTRLSSAVKNAPSKVNAGAIKMTLSGAKTKFASLTKGVRLGVTGKLGKANAGRLSTITTTAGAAGFMGGVGMLVLGAVNGFDMFPGALGMSAGAGMMSVGAMLAHDGL